MAADADSPNAPTGEVLREYNRRLAAVTLGMSRAEVESLLGRPEAVHEGKPADGPTDTFVSLGMHLNFGEQNADEVWAFRDPYRPRRVNYFAFRAGCVCASWRDTQAPQGSS